MSHTQTIHEMYLAFQRGDIGSILHHLAESVEWEYGTMSTSVPWLQRRHGRDGAAAFFASLSGMDLHRFEPKEFLEGERVVVVLLDVEFTVKATGKRVAEEDEIHVWRFDSSGQIIRFRHGVDTHLHQLAWTDNRQGKSCLHSYCAVGARSTSASGAGRGSNFNVPHVFGRSCVITSFGADQK